MTSEATNAPEFAARESGSVRVLLRWHPCEDAVTVAVEGACAGRRFELTAARDRALDAFCSPSAYAA